MKHNSKIRRKNNYSLNESRVIVDKNGEPQVLLSENIEKNGFMSLEEARRLLIETVEKIYEINGCL